MEILNYCYAKKVRKKDESLEWKEDEGILKKKYVCNAAFQA